MASPVKGNTSFDFWSVPTVEPKRAFKFMVTIPGFQPFLVAKADRPSVTIGETPHKFLNHTFYYPLEIYLEMKLKKIQKLEKKLLII